MKKFILLTAAMIFIASSITLGQELKTTDTKKTTEKTGVKTDAKPTTSKTTSGDPATAKPLPDQKPAVTTKEDNVVTPTGQKGNPPSGQKSDPPTGTKSTVKSTGDNAAAPASKTGQAGTVKPASQGKSTTVAPSSTAGNKKSEKAKASKTSKHRKTGDPSKSKLVAPQPAEKK